MLKKARSFFIHLDKTPEYDGRTDGRMDRNGLASTAVCIATCGDVASADIAIDIVMLSTRTVYGVCTKYKSSRSRNISYRILLIIAGCWRSAAVDRALFLSLAADDGYYAVRRNRSQL